MGLPMGGLVDKQKPFTTCLNLGIEELQIQSTLSCLSFRNIDDSQMTRTAPPSFPSLCLCKENYCPFIIQNRRWSGVTIARSPAACKADDRVFHISSSFHFYPISFAFISVLAWKPELHTCWARSRWLWAPLQ